MLYCHSLFIIFYTKQTLELKQDIKESVKDVTKNIQILNKKLHKLENRSILQERKLRKNNVIIFGLDLNSTDLANEVIQKVNELVGTNFELSNINNVYKIGKTSKPPVVIEFISFLKKLDIFKNTEKLKALKEKNISIANDLCEEDREEQKILRKHLKEARQKNIPAKIKGHKIQIEDKLYTASELEERDTETEYESNEESDSEIPVSEFQEQKNTEKGTKTEKTADSKRKPAPSPKGTTNRTRQQTKKRRY